MNDIEKVVTIEDAIAWFEWELADGKCNDHCPQCNANEMALDTLREVQKREKGCEFCHKPYSSISGVNDDKSIVYLGTERPYAKGNTEYLHHMDRAGRMNAFKIKFCPMCGRRLEEHHKDD